MGEKITVGELIEKLSQFDSNMNIKTHFSFGEYSHELEYIDRNKTKVILSHDDKDLLLILESIRNDPIEHYFD